MKKINLTVVFTKNVPVEIEYKKNDTNDSIVSKCIEEAKKKITPLGWDIQVVGTITDFIKNKL